MGILPMSPSGILPEGSPGSMTWKVMGHIGKMPMLRHLSYNPHMELAYRKLDESEAKTALASTPGWTIEDEKLTKNFKFEAYKDGVVFASAVGFVADKLNHHPDILVGYAKVNIAVNTHDVGGLSPYDFELAKRIDAL